MYDQAKLNISRRIKRMLAIALGQAVMFFFTNFTYTFGNKIYLQASGGPIGARLRMVL